MLRPPSLAVSQGLAQDVFTAALGGVRDPLLALGAVSDPSVLPSASELQPLMGTLSGGLRLPAFVVAPSAAVLTAALESGWFWVALSLRDESSRCGGCAGWWGAQVLGGRRAAPAEQHQ